MNSRTRKAGFIVGMMLMMMAVATTSYASTAVVSYDFSNSAQVSGFNVGIDGTFRPNCIVSEVKSWSADGSMQIAVNQSGDCSGYALTVSRSVSLSSAIANPSTQMVIKDSSNSLDLAHPSVAFTNINDARKIDLALIIVLNSQGWSTLAGNWSAGANSGAGTIEYYLPLRCIGNGGSAAFNVYIDDVEIDSN